MIKFGPAGISQDYIDEGYSRTIDIPKWLKERGVDSFEYSFGRGVQLKEDTARAIGAEFDAYGIEMSAHAPYFINLATTEELKAKNNHRYILTSLAALRWFGGRRCVFHPGAPLKADRREAMTLLLERLRALVADIYDKGYGDMYICAETMGKKAQLGTVDEVIEMVNVDDIILPCFDFGHINAREGGILRTKDDYVSVLSRLIDGVGYEKAKIMHIHFSKIQYTAAGEYKHLTFADDLYGPEFEPLAEAIDMLKLEPYIICESAGTQTADALYMKNYYYNNILFKE